MSALADMLEAINCKVWEAEMRRAPVQGEVRRDSKGEVARPVSWIPMGTISWEEHEAAWRAYDAKWRCGQSAERIAERAGFSYYELCDLLGHEPRTWTALAAGEPK
jgi:hypothetical protein